MAWRVLEMKRVDDSLLKNWFPRETVLGQQARTYPPRRRVNDARLPCADTSLSASACFIFSVVSRLDLHVASCADQFSL
jgi:hypothetical protein